MHTRMLFALGWIGLCCACATAPLPEFANPAPVSFPVRVLELPSGLRIVIQEDRTRPLVSVVSVVGVGSSGDPQGREGLAHLIEHLTFRSRPDGRIRLDEMLRLGGTSYFNASTERDLTTFEQIGPTEALAAMLRAEGARLMDPLKDVEEATLQSERGVVLNELWQRDETGQNGQLLQAFSDALYPPEHPYRHTPGGNAGALEATTLEDARRFVHEHYLPSRMTLVIAGDVNAAELPRLLDTTLPAAFLEPASGKSDSLSKSEPPEPPPEAPMPTIPGDVHETNLLVAWTLPGQLGPQNIVNEFLAAHFRQQLGRTWAFEGVKGVRVDAFPGQQASMLVLTASLKKDARPDVVRTQLLKAFDKVWGGGTLTEAYLVQKYVFPNLLRSVLVQLELEHESLLRKAVTRAQDSHFNADTRTFSRLNEDVSNIDRDTLEKLGKAYLSSRRARFVVVVPRSVGPVSPDAAATPLAADDRVRAMFAAEAFSRFTHAPTARAWRSFVLPSGLEVVLVPRASTGMVSLSLAAPASEASATSPASTRFLPYLGATRKNGAPLGVGASESLEVEGDTAVLQYRGSSLNLPNLVAILTERLSSQRLSEYSWPKESKEVRDELSRELGDPARRFPREFDQQTWAGTAYGRVHGLAELDALHPQDVNDWLARTFVPGKAKLAVVGDFDALEAEKIVRQRLASWTGPGAVAGPASQVPEAPSSGGWLLEERPGVPQAEIAFGCRLQAKTESEELAASLLAIELERDLRNFARDQAGGSYGFEKRTTHFRTGDVALKVHGLTANRSFARVLVHGRALWSSLAHKNFTEEELSRARWSWSQSYNLAYETSAPLSQAVATSRLAGRPAQSMLTTPEVVAALTPKDLDRAARACAAAWTLGVVGDKSVLQTTRNIQGATQNKADGPAGSTPQTGP